MESLRNWRAWGTAVLLEMALLLTAAAPYRLRILSRSSWCEGQTASQISRGFRASPGQHEVLSVSVSHNHRGHTLLGRDFVHSPGILFPFCPQLQLPRQERNCPTKVSLTQMGDFLLESTSFSAEGFEVLPLFFQACWVVVFFFFPSLKMIDKILESHLLVQTE